MPARCPACTRPNPTVQPTDRPCPAGWPSWSRRAVVPAVSGDLRASVGATSMQPKDVGSHPADPDADSRPADPDADSHSDVEPTDPNDSGARVLDPYDSDV